MKIGYIKLDHCHGAQDNWVNAFNIIFKEFNITPDIISSPEEVKKGFHYIWRPSHTVFNNKYNHTSLLSKKLSEYAKKFEDQGATIYPSSKSLSFYENKVEIYNIKKKKQSKNSRNTPF